MYMSAMLQAVQMVFEIGTEAMLQNEGGLARLMGPHCQPLPMPVKLES
jgi:hypothetical protein